MTPERDRELELFILKMQASMHVAKAVFWLAVTGLLILTAQLISGCGQPPQPQPPGPSVDAGTGTCAEACANLRTLRCPAAQPTQEGASCETVCENVQSSGIVSWNLGCRASAPSCDSVDGCER